jgi:hypothetical protein
MPVALALGEGPYDLELSLGERRGASWGLPDLRRLSRTLSSMLVGERGYKEHTHTTPY